jgi:hypothetical protein
MVLMGHEVMMGPIDFQRAHHGPIIQKWAIRQVARPTAAFLSLLGFGREMAELFAMLDYHSEPV